MEIMIVITDIEYDETNGDRDTNTEGKPLFEILEETASVERCSAVQLTA